MGIKKRKELTSNLLKLALLSLLALGFWGIERRLDTIFTYMTRHMIKVEQDYIEKEKYEADVGTCSAKLENQEDIYEELEKYINERCVCIQWDNNSDEPPMTKREICNYPYPMGSYSKIQGHSKLEHWEPMEDRK